MELMKEIVAFGQEGSRKSQAFAFGAVALLAGPSLGLDVEATHYFAGLCGVYIVARAIHDFALTKVGAV